MIFKNILKPVGILSLIAGTLANECDTLRTLCLKKELITSSNNIKCEVNGDGKATSIILRSARITQEVADLIGSYSSLEDLAINDGFIEDIKYDSWKNLISLSLHDAEYETNELPSFDIFQNLKYLKISYITPTNENTKKIGNLPHLEELVFEAVNMNEMDIEPLLKLNLTRLELRCDNMNEKVLKLASKNKNLKYLSSFYDFKSFPDFIFDLKNLEELYLFNNSIDSIPDEIETLKNLKILTIREKVNKVSEKIGNLSNLERLDLGVNELKSFPKGIENLKNLEYLNLSHNKIDSEIPEAYNDLPNLKEIYLDNNVNIKGKTLTNESLNVCVYNINYDLCLSKEMSCFYKNSGYYYYVSCDSNKNPEQDNIKISTDGRCGKGKGVCPDNGCCSKYGYCGTKDKYCEVSQGCQSEFGKCNGVKVEKVSTNGRCGTLDGSCPTGECCSKYGYCGHSEKHCKISLGCQSEFGKCDGNDNESEKVEKVSTNGQCGDSYGRCPSGQCCSKYGWCGKSSKYCEAGCQTKFGECH